MSDAKPGVGARLAKWVQRVPYRLKKELRAPKTSAGLALLEVRRRAGAALGRLRFQTGSGDALDADALVACYDLGHWPITYDFLWFMIAAELVRREQSLASLHILVVPTEDWESGSEGRDYYAVIDGPARQQRLFDILLPSIALLPSIRGLTLATSRRQASRLIAAAAGREFPGRYTPAMPRLPFYGFSNVVFEAAAAGRTIPTFVVPEGARAWVERWQRGLGDDRPYVTITLRYFGHNPVRNSNLEAWGAFAREIAEQGLRPVIVPDTHMTLDPMPDAFAGVPIFHEAAWHVHLRAALYEAAFLNLGVNTGPMSLCWFNPRCRFISFKYSVEDGGVGSIEAQILRGHDPRKPVPFLSPYQKVVIEADDLPVIRREFEAMRRLIEADAASVAVPLP